MMVSRKAYKHVCSAPRNKDHIPAVPHRPKPALRTTEPLLMSATASSAFLKSLDAPRFGFGARVAWGTACDEYLPLVWNLRVCSC